MLIIAITGNIACGKTTITQMFMQYGGDYFDADRATSRLFTNNEYIYKEISSNFSDICYNGLISKHKLSDLVFKDDNKNLRILESILHPEIERERIRFIEKSQKLGRKFVICEIPLLFELNQQSNYDVNILICAPKFLQKIRAMRRSQMTEKKLAFIQKNQLNQNLKRKLADIEIKTGLNKAYSAKQVKKICKKLHII